MIEFETITLTQDRYLANGRRILFSLHDGLWMGFKWGFRVGLLVRVSGGGKVKCGARAGDLQEKRAPSS